MGHTSLLRSARHHRCPPCSLTRGLGVGVSRSCRPCCSHPSRHLSIVTGLDILTLEEGGRQLTRVALWTTSWFHRRFRTVYVLLGLTRRRSAPVTGSSSVPHRRLRRPHARHGAVLIGSIFCARRGCTHESASIPSPSSGTARRHPSRRRRVRVRWSPCFGPILGRSSALRVAAARLGRSGVCSPLLPRSRPPVSSSADSRWTAPPEPRLVKRHYQVIRDRLAIVLRRLRESCVMFY